MSTERAVPGTNEAPYYDFGSFVVSDCDKGHVSAVDDGDGGVYGCQICRAVSAEASLAEAQKAADSFEHAEYLALLQRNEARQDLARTQASLAKIRARCSELIRLARGSASDFDAGAADFARYVLNLLAAPSGPLTDEGDRADALNQLDQERDEENARRRDEDGQDWQEWVNEHG